MQGILEDNPKIPSNFVHEERDTIASAMIDRKKSNNIYGMDKFGFLLFWEREEKSIDYCIELYCFYRIGIAAVLV